MSDTNQSYLDRETIHQLGLRPSRRKLNAQLAPNARVFELPDADHVYLMESDLYGNLMPEGSLFLAFNSSTGLIGKHIKIETLRNSTVEDIKKMVADNQSG